MWQILQLSDGSKYAQLSAELEQQVQRNSAFIVSAYVEILRSHGTGSLIRKLRSLVRQRVELGFSLASISAVMSEFTGVVAETLQSSPPSSDTTTATMAELSKKLVVLTMAIVEHHHHNQTLPHEAEDCVGSSWTPPLKESLKVKTQGEKDTLLKTFQNMQMSGPGKDMGLNALQRLFPGQSCPSQTMLLSGCLVDNRYKIVKYICDGTLNPESLYRT